MTETTPKRRAPEARPKPKPADYVVNSGVLLLGVILGMVDLVSNAQNELRIPALLAAMLMFASSLSQIVADAKWSPGEGPSEEEAPVGRAVQRGASAPPAAAPPAKSPLIPLLVIGLACWVGIAALLSPTAEPALRALSLLAAFLLSYSGINEVRDQQQG